MNTKSVGKMKNIWKKHKLWIAVAVIFIVAVVIGSVVTPSAAPSVVKLVGFGPAGLIPGSWAAREHNSLRNTMKPSTFDVARRIGMGGPVPWYGWVYGGLILGVLVLVACGLIILIISMYRRAFRRSRQDFHPLPENKSENKRSNPI